MLSWFIAAALILIFELFVGTIYLLVVSAALFGAGLAELLFGQTTISVLTAAVLAAVGIWWAKGNLSFILKLVLMHLLDVLWMQSAIFIKGLSITLKCSAFHQNT